MGCGFSQPWEVEPKWFPEFESELPSMSGKVVAVTGCTTGTGIAAALTLAKKGALVLMLNRESERATSALEQVKTVASGPSPVHITCDLTDFASVKKCAAQIKAQCSTSGLDVLCCNAGQMALPNGVGKDGYEIQLTTNHLSHALLTKEVLPVLEAAANRSGNARVIMHSSQSRIRPSEVVEKNYTQNPGDIAGNDFGSRMRRYEQTKFANCLFSVCLDEKLKAKGSKVQAMWAHPGLSATNLQVTSVAAGVSGCMLSMFLTLMGAQSKEDGSMGILKCCAAPNIKSGIGYGPGFTGGKKWNKGPVNEIENEATIVDAKNKERCWTFTEKIIGPVL